MNTSALGRVIPFPAEGVTIGTVLKNSYRIIRPLAEGGGGELYVARHTRLSCEVAVKILHRSLARDALALARFRQEAKITSGLRHPHIVQIIDVDATDQGVPYLVMELVEGQTLCDRLFVDEPLEIPAALDLVEQIAEALHAAHQRGVVHRDLKPENVMLTPVDGRDFAKLVDFGIARASWQASLSGEAIVAGTPRYMAPEQARGLRGEIDHRADQFSLAAMTYRLLTGYEPFVGDDPATLLHQVVHDEPRPPSAIAPSLSRAVDAVLGRAMSKRKEDRYPHILAFATALRESIEVLEPPVRRRQPMPSSLHRIRGRAGGSFLLALAAVLALAWFCPATRDGTRGVWRRARADAGRLFSAAHLQLCR